MNGAPLRAQSYLQSGDAATSQYFGIDSTGSRMLKRSDTKDYDVEVWDDPTVRDYAARSWCTWEDAHVSLTPGLMPSPHFDDPEFRLGFARLVTHYWRHAAFLAEDQLIRDASRLNGIPGVLIHGRYDVSGALVTAWKLHKQWATSRLHVLDDAGHGGGRDFMPLVLHALSEFAVL